ncbi:MAG TPA: alpha-L-fucosidase C-terminal domain-containing protein [Paludibacter sp.]|nr:alpha-L-fucosidase C-terminal domain-containing protein [Paludibacter sp.]
MEFGSRRTTLCVAMVRDGTIDDKEVAILEGVAAWMDENKESVFDTRPWKVYGEGPSVEEKNPMKEQGFNEGNVKFTSKDIRYAQKTKALYASLLGVPTEEVCVKLLGESNLNKKIKSINILGSEEKLNWRQNTESLFV